jgi:hypothetical protein
MILTRTSSCAAAMACAATVVKASAKGASTGFASRADVDRPGGTPAAVEKRCCRFSTVAASLVTAAVSCAASICELMVRMLSASAFSSSATRELRF